MSRAPRSWVTEIGLAALAAVMLAAPAAANISFSSPSDTPDPVNPGAQLTYAVSIGHSGGDDTGVTLTITPDSDITFNAAASTAGLNCTGTSPVTCAVGTLSGGGSATGSVVFDVAGTATGTLSSSFSADSNESAAIPHTVSTTVSRADLKVVKTLSSSAAVPGQNLVYTVDVSNALLKSPAVNVVLSDPAPTGLTGPTFSGDCAGATCNLGTINPGPLSAKSVTVTFGIPANYHVVGGNPATISNTASVTSDTFDDDTSDNSDTVSGTTVSPRSQLVVDKTGPAQAVPGQNLVYTVTVQNNGPSVAAGVTFRDVAPTGLPTASFTGDCTSAGPTCSLGNVLVGAANKKTVTVTFALPGNYHFATLGNPASITNVADLPTPPPDTVPASSTYSDTVITSVSPSADLSLSGFTDSQTTATPGAPIVYHATVHNAGPSSVDALTLALSIPSVLSPVYLPSEGAFNSGGSWIGVDLAAGEDITLDVAGWLDSSLNPDGGGFAAGLAASGTLSSPPSVPDLNTGSGQAITDTDTLQGNADLEIVKNDGVDFVVPPGTTAYSIVVTNPGPSRVSGANVHDLFDATRLSAVSWICTAPATLTALETLANGGTISGLGGATSVVVSPDGKSVYVTGFNDNAVAFFSRDTATGTLAFVAAYINGGGSPTISGIAGASGLAISADGAQVYVTGQTSNAVAVFNRNLTPGVDFGKLTFVQAIVDGPSSNGLGGARSVLVSQDGVHVYVAGFTDNAVAILSRNHDSASPNFGRLTYQGMLADSAGTDGLAGATGLALDPSGKYLYVTGATDNAVAVLSRDPATNTLTWVSRRANGDGGGGGSPTGLGLATGVVVSPDGLHVYVTGATGNAMTTFSRNAGTGALTLAGTITDSDPGIDGLAGARGIAIAPDGKHVYVAGRTDNLLAIFSRAIPGGGLTFERAVGLNGATAPASSPGGETLYLTGFTANTLAVFAQTPGGSCGALASGSGFTLDGSVDIPPGASLVIDTTASILASATGNLTNLATVTAPAFVTDPASAHDPGECVADASNNACTDVDEMRRQADLVVTKIAGAASAVPGSTLTYTITVTNNGPATVDPVTVSDAALGGASFSSVSWTCTPSGGAVCESASGSAALDEQVSMPAGGTLTFQVTVGIKASATGVACTSGPGNCLVNTATATFPVGGGFTDPTPANSTATVETPILRQHDLSITKVATNDAAPGDALGFTITVQNCGPSDATGAIVSDTFPAIYTSATWWCEVVQGAGTTCPAGSTNSGSPIAGSINNVSVDLPAGNPVGCSGAGTVVFHVNGTVDPEAEGILSNIAQVSSPFDTNTGNNRSTARVFLSAEADLEVVKDDARTEAVPGSPVTYSITVTNAGPDNVEQAHVTDPFPDTLRDVSWTCSSQAPALGTLTFIEDQVNTPASSFQDSPRNVAVSGDGRHVYVTALGDDAVAVYSRNLVTGRLELIQIVRQGDSHSTGIVSGLDGANGVVVSPDGKNVYVTGSLDNTLVNFTRETNVASPDFGKLTFVEKVQDGQLQNSLTVDGLKNALSVAASPDGVHLYVAGFDDDAVAIFSRDATDRGLLSFKGAVKNNVAGITGLAGPVQVSVSPGGQHVYVASFGSSAVAVFTRNVSTGLLTPLQVLEDSTAPVIPGAVSVAGALLGASALRVSPDGAHLYVASATDDGVAVFARGNNPLDPPNFGKLTYLSSRTDGDVGGLGGAADGLDEASGITVSADGQHVYVTGRSSSAVAVFQRNPTTGGLKFIESRRNGNIVPCVADQSGCLLTHLNGAVGLALSPTDDHLYVVSENSDAVTVFRRAGIPPAFGFVGGTPDADPPEPVRDGDVQASGTVDGLAGAAGVATSADGGFVYAVGFADNSVAVFSRNNNTGALSFVQRLKEGLDGITGLQGAIGVTVYDTSVYVIGQSVTENLNTVAVFTRDTGTGMLTLLEVQREGVAGVSGIFGASGIAVSPLGDHVYVTGQFPGSVAVFGRAPNGHLTWLQKKTVGIGGVVGIGGASSVAVSSDGAHVYVTGATDDALVVFSRNTLAGPSAGFLTQLQVFQDPERLPAIAGAVKVQGLDQPLGVAVSPQDLIDGSPSRNVYVATHSDDALVVFARNIDNSSPAFGTLTAMQLMKDGVGVVDGLNGARAVQVSLDGKQVYVAGEDDDALAIFARAETGGSLVFVEARKDGVGGVDGIDQAYALTVAPSGRHIYVAGFGDNAIAAFSRASGSRCTGSGIGNIDDLVDVAAGGQVVYSVTGTVDPAATGTLENTATVSTGSAQVSEPSPSPHAAGVCPASPDDNNVCLDVDTLTPRGDIGITKTDGTDAVVPGESHTYTIHVTNAGPSNVKGAVVEDNLSSIFPAGASWTCVATQSGTLTFVQAVADGATQGPNTVSGLDGATGVATSPDGHHLYAVGLAGDAIAVFDIGLGDGKLTWKQTIKDGVGSDALDGAAAVAVSADGKNVYVASSIDDTLVVFTRNLVTGLLTASQVLQEAASSETNPIPGAILVNGLDQATSVALDPDPDGAGVDLGGHNVYVAAANSNAVTVFSRDAGTGALTFVARYRDGVEVPDGLAGANAVVVSPDARHVYALGANDGAVVSFTRNTGTGVLSYLGTKANGGGITGLTAARGLAVSPDGASVYVAGPTENAVVVFDRSAAEQLLCTPELVSAGGCTAGDLGNMVTNPSFGSLTFVATYVNGAAGMDGLAGASAITVSGDGFQLYVTGAAEGSISVLRRNGADHGKLTFVDAVRNGSGSIDGLEGAAALTLRPDGRFLYVAGRVDDALAVFSRPANTSCASGSDTSGPDIRLLDTVDIAAGSEIVYQVTGVIAPDACPPPYPCSSTSLVNVATVTPPSGGVFTDTNNGDDTASDSDHLGARVDLSITKRDEFVAVRGLAGASSVATSANGQSVYATGLIGDGVAVFSRNAGTGELTYLESKRDSVAGVDGLNGATAVAISPDDRHVYVAGSADNAIAVFVRDPATGRLTFLERKANNVDGVTDILGVSALVVSKDGKQVYAAAVGSNSVVAFTRDASSGSANFGRLTPKQVLKDGIGGVDGLAGARGVALTPDAAHLYVAGSSDNAVAELRRDTVTGDLTYIGLVQNGAGGVQGLGGPLAVAVSPDGKHVYAAATSTNSVAAFARDGAAQVLCTAPLVSAGVCTNGQLGQMVTNPGYGKLTFVAAYVDGAGGVDGLAGAAGIVVRPDPDGSNPDPGGQYVYVAGLGDDAIAIFARNAATGALTFQGTLPNGGSVSGLDGVRGLAMSPDATSLYAAAQTDSAVVATATQPSGALTFISSYADGGGGAAPGDALHYHIVVSNAGPSAVVGAKVTDVFPGELTNVSWTCVPLTPGASCLPAGTGDIVHESVTLPPNGKVEFIAVATIKPGTTGAVVNTATVSEPVGVIDVDPTNNSATDDDTVLSPKADLRVEKIACSDPNDCVATQVTEVVPGTPVYYQVTVHDDGPSDSHGAMLTDILPGVLSDTQWSCVGAPMPGLLSPLPAIPSTALQGLFHDGDSLPGVLLGSCGDPDQTNVDGLQGATGLALASDGLSVYAFGAGDDAVAVFRRDLRSGHLVFVDAVRDGDPIKAPAPGCGVIGAVDGIKGAVTGVVSADGHFLYVAGRGEDSVAIFGRDSLTSALTFVGFVRDGVAGVNGLGGVRGLALSPDGAHLYAAAPADNGIGIFSRSAGSGLLTYLGLVTDGQVQGAVTVDGLAGASAVTVSPDGRHVYVTGELDDAVAVFSRDAATGALTFLQMLHDGDGLVDGLAGPLALSMSAGGESLYVAGTGEDAIAALERDTAATVVCTNSLVSSGGCSAGQLGNVVVNPHFGHLTFAGVVQQGLDGTDGLTGVRALAVSPDGRHLYAAGRGDDAIAVFRRDAGTGGLSFVTRIADGLGGVDGLDGASGVAVSGDGGQVYATGAADNALAVFVREPGSTCTDAGFGPILDATDLAAGGSVTYTISGTLSPSATGTLTNTAQVQSGAGYPDPTAANDVATVDLDLTPHVGLTMTKDDGQSSAVPGMPLTYTITVSNAGPSDLRGGTLDDPFPAGFQASGWTCTASSALTFLDAATQGVAGFDGLAGAAALVVSPDPDGAGVLPGGQHVYASSTSSSSIAALGWDGSALSPIAVVTDDVAGFSNLGGARGLAMSADGEFLYVAASVDSAVTVLHRDIATGLLSYVGAVREDDQGVDGLEGTTGLALSGEGRFAFATGAIDNAVVALRRDADTGELTFVNREKAGFGDVPLDAIGGPSAVLVTPDDRHVLVAGSDSDTLAVFAIDPDSGHLSFVAAYHDGVGGVDGLDLVNGLAISASGLDVYVTALADDSVALFHRDAETGLLTYVTRYSDGIGGVDGLDGASAVAVAADGEYVYASGRNDNAIAVFHRNGADGSLQFVEMQHDGVGGTTGIGGPRALAVSPDRVHLFAASETSSSVAAFARTGAAHCGGSGTGDLSDTIDIAVGGSVVYTVTGAVDSGATGSLVNTATATMPSGTTNGGDTSATDTDTLTPAADLSISKDDGATTATPGGTVTYTIVVANAGPSSAPGSVVTDPFPVGGITAATWACAGASGGSCTNGSGSGPLNETVNLPVGGQVTFTMVATVDPAATGTLTNVASVSPAAGISDPGPAPNSDDDVDNVLAGVADLSMTKTAASPAAAPGQTLDFTLQVDNAGPASAVDVHVVDTLPTGVSATGANGTGWSCVVGATTVTCDRPTAAVGASPPITVSVTAPASAGPHINSATVSSANDTQHGNDTGTAQFVVDTPPTVLGVNSTPDTGDGSLDQMETAALRVTDLKVTFSEPMFNPAGNAAAHDVTNPASYMLLEAGADGNFATITCGPVAGDDVVVPILGAVYGAGDTVTLNVANLNGLDDGLYRLFVCASLRDADSGSSIDGDADGFGGDDFTRTFRTRVKNLVAHGFFDFASDLGAFTISQANPGDVIHDPSTDADSFPLSGAAMASNLDTSATARSLAQCVVLNPSVRAYDLCGRARIDATGGASVDAGGSVQFATDNACSSLIGLPQTAAISGDTSGAFQSFKISVEAPPSALSARLVFSAVSTTADSFDVFLDSLCLVPTPPYFLSGFESGDTSEWTETVP